jgi:SagB-type dehydrogenase family enzyme
MTRTHIWNYLFLLVISITGECNPMFYASSTSSPLIHLPDPSTSGGLPLSSALTMRRSHRNFSTAPLTLSELGQLLWAAQGITHPQGFRTAPSAGALYPIEIYVAAANVNELQPAIYHYDPQQHTLQLWHKGDKYSQLYAAAYLQKCIKKSAAVIAINAVFARTKRKYHQRGKRYVHIEAGNVAQNIYLQATVLKLGTVYVGAFSDSAVQQVLKLPKEVEPLGLMPVGHLP